MAEFTGKNLYAEWVYSGGTVVLSGNQRTLSAAPSVGLVDASAGSDTHKTYLVALKDGTYSYSGLLQEGGTAVLNALVEGTSGTLVIGKEGTAAGKPKESVPAISMGPQENWPYDNVCEFSCQFQQNGAPVDSTY